MSNPAWTIPDEEPVTCEGCGLRSYDTDGWTTTPDYYCPDCFDGEEDELCP